jgi:hypothetical protein
MTGPEHASSRVHRGDHAALLDVIPDLDSRRSAIDAIVVPTARPADHLQAAADLARGSGSLLVVLCSAESRARTVKELVSGVPGIRALVIDVPDSYEHRLLRFSTSAHRHAQFPQHRDLSTKRNAGLLLARMLGWRRILFVDDDIRGLDARQLDLASSRMGAYRAAGFQIMRFPDNSVVCHAHRLGGGQQRTFLGANALLVDVPLTDSFFPVVYNEDWMFLFDSLQAREVAAVGTAWQLPYDPYASPARADSEEFGDTVAEGLLWLLHEGVDASGSDKLFWQACLERRRVLIDQVSDRLCASDDGRGQIKRAIKALAAAKERHDDIEPGDCESFITDWRSDLTEWSERLLVLPRFTSLRRALRFLGLSGISIEVI